MKIPRTFIPENKDLDVKVQELAEREYVPKTNVEEKALLEDMLHEEYTAELTAKRKKWWQGDHLNKPGTNKISPKRLIFNSTMMLLSIAGSVYLFTDLADCIPSYLRFPSFLTLYVGLPSATYKIIAESMIRYDVGKKYKEKK